MKHIADIAPSIIRETSQPSIELDSDLPESDSMRDAEPPQEILEHHVSAEIAGQLSLFDPHEIVRPDGNIGRWAGVIFSSPWSNNLKETKVIHVEKRGQGSASISIVPGNGPKGLLKRPTTTTLRVYYALLQLWEEQGKKTDGKVAFSSRQLAHLIGWKWAGKDTVERIQEHLEILRKTSIDWLYTFNAEEKGKLEQGMNLIHGKTYAEKINRKKGEYFASLHSTNLNPLLVDNMLAGRTKPVNYHAFASIRGDTELALYNMLDNFLAKKCYWERRSRALLIDDLEMTGERNEIRSVRKQTLNKFVKNLNGKELSSGKLQLDIKKTSDGSDWKLCARKIPRVARPCNIPKTSANPKAQIPNIVDEIVEGLNFLGGAPASSVKLLETFAWCYPRQMLRERLSVLKADYRGMIKTSPIKAYVYLVHVEVHRSGKKWIKDCGSECKHRPENRKQNQGAGKAA